MIRGRMARDDSCATAIARASNNAIKYRPSGGQRNAFYNDMAGESTRDIAPHLVEIDGGHFAWTGEPDACIVLDAPGSRRHYHYAIGKHDCLLDRVRHKNNGDLRALPDLE